MKRIENISVAILLIELGFILGMISYGWYDSILQNGALQPGMVCPNSPEFIKFSNIAKWPLCAIAIVIILINIGYQLSSPDSVDTHRDDGDKQGKAHHEGD